MLKRHAPSQQRKQRLLTQQSLNFNPTNHSISTTDLNISTTHNNNDINNNKHNLSEWNTNTIQCNKEDLCSTSTSSVVSNKDTFTLSNTCSSTELKSLKRKLSDGNNDIPSSSSLPTHSILIQKYNVLWRIMTSKSSNRKKWDGDGVLYYKDHTFRLVDSDGLELGKKIGVLSPPSLHQIYKLGNKEIEITEELPSETLVKPSVKNLNASSSASSFVFPSPNHIDLNPVVLDSILSKHIRPHQWLGVQFLYSCVMGLNHPEYLGALLCDEMGCGKTLQSIALIWTLLKQNPNGGDPIAKKVLIVCPASLIRFWQAEFKKWLGDERVRTFAVDSKSTFTDFLIGRVYPIMIIGYEKLVSVYQVLHECPFDIILCDEGHRLKSTKNKAAMALRSLNTKRRIILSGTPIQNDLSEYFAMLDFVNPGIFGTHASFKATFEDPIFQGQQPDTDSNTREFAKTQFDKLVELTSPFVLRRTMDHLKDFLPSRTQFLIYLPFTSLQQELYLNVMRLNTPLEQLMLLRKLCNHPYANQELELMQREFSSSPKCHFVQRLVETLLNKTNEKMVIVSRFNPMLDLMEFMLKKMEVTWFRLDGSTALTKREDQIQAFNRSQSSTRVFLLSAKAGGLGLSLVGASRLILFEMDWNPALDRQVMARIWREGQVKPVYFYRLIMQGTLEEIMLQRQVAKTNLSLQVLDGIVNLVNEFNQEELYVFRHPTFHESCFKIKDSIEGCQSDPILESLLDENKSNEEKEMGSFHVMTLKNE